MGLPFAKTYEGPMATRSSSESKVSGGPTPSRPISDLSAYDAVSSLEKIGRCRSDIQPLKLDWNESTIPPSPRVIQAVLDFLHGNHPLNWYPDLAATPLREAIGRYTGVPADNILITNGSDAALDLVCRTYLDPGDCVDVVWPTYGHFLVFARACGAVPREIEPSSPFEVPTEVLLERVQPDTKIVYIASPNNPTGVVTPAADVARICEAFPSSLVIVDEAYHEFCGETAAALVRTLDNLVVTRTFSKCFSIAAVRVGYLLAAHGVMRHLRKLHNPKSVNALGQVAALAALEDREFRERFVAQVREAGEVLVAALRERGAEARTTRANFVLVRVANPGRLVKALEEEGVFVRDRSHIRGFEGYVRITLGTCAQMVDLIERLDRLLARDPLLLAPP